jgi:uncharacterized protein involved in outer membrane biogenesis
MATLLRRFIVGLAALMALAILAFVVAVSLEIEIDLSPLRRPAESIASAALGREVRLAGAMTLVPTLSPTAEIHDVRVGNPAGWGKEDFLRMSLARVEVGILPLLFRRVSVREIRAEGVELNLRERRDGAVNWHFEPSPVAATAADTSRDDAKPASTQEMDFLRWELEIDKLALANILVSRQGPEDPEPIVLGVRELDARAATDKPFQLRASGSYRGHPYAFSLEGGSPKELLEGSANWPLEIELEIAETRLAISGLIHSGRWTIEELASIFLDPDPNAEPQRFADLEISLEGARLDSLDTLVGISLPPLGRHSTHGRFGGYTNGRFDSQIAIKVNESELVGSLEVQVASDPPSARLELVSETIQLADIDLGQWSAFEAAPPDAGAATPAAPDDTSVPLDASALLSPETLRRLDLAIDVRVAEVRSGRDRLGAARLTAQLAGGAFSLRPLVIEIPGGSLEIEMEIETGLAPEPDEIAAHFRFAIDRFDYGIMARRIDPGTQMAGLFSLDVDLATRAETLDDLMVHANGTIDFAIFPSKFEAGIFDLWAVNLMSAVLPKIDESQGSRINCVVGLFDLHDGRLEQKSILVDTSRMSVGGRARVDFATKEVDVMLEPRSKKPEFFSLATPIRVSGSIADFEIGVRFEDILGTIVTFATSPIHVPIRTIFGTTVPAEGWEACEAAGERDTRKMNAAPP